MQLIRRGYGTITLLLLGLLCCSTTTTTLARDNTAHGLHVNNMSSTTDHSTVLISAQLAKRTQTPAPTQPNTDNFQTFFADLDQAGWTLRFVPGHLFLPTLTSSRYLTGYLTHAMAIMAARMLANVPLTGYVIIDQNGPLTLTVVASRRCAGCGRLHGNLSWEFAYYLLLFLRSHADRGFAGTGTLYLGHRGSRTSVRATLALRPGLGQVVQRPCGSQSFC